MKIHLLILCALVSQSRGFSPTPRARRQATVLAVSIHSNNYDDDSGRRKVMTSLIAASLSLVPSISQAKVRPYMFDLLSTSTKTLTDEFSCIMVLFYRT